MPKRCEWVGDSDDIDDILVKYYDEVWDTPKRDDRRLFEDLVLDGAHPG